MRKKYVYSVGIAIIAALSIDYVSSYGESLYDNSERNILAEEVTSVLYDVDGNVLAEESNSTNK